MRFNIKSFPILDNIKNGNNIARNMQLPAVDYKEALKRKEYLERSVIFKGLLPLLRNGTAKVQYITEPIRRLVDGLDDIDMRVGKKLWRARDIVQTSSGMFLLPDKGFYAYMVYNNKDEQKVRFCSMQGIDKYITAVEQGSWPYGGVEGALYVQEGNFDNTAESFENYRYGYCTQMIIQFLMFLQTVDIETKIIDGRPGKGQRKTKAAGKKMFNELPFTLEIIDSTFYQRIVRTEGFKVSTHLRWQPYGPGLSKKKLILIDEFEKKGYTRRAKKEL